MSFFPLPNHGHAQPVTNLSKRRGNPKKVEAGHRQRRTSVILHVAPTASEILVVTTLPCVELDYDELCAAVEVIVPASFMVGGCSALCQGWLAGTPSPAIAEICNQRLEGGRVGASSETRAQRLDGVGATDRVAATTEPQTECMVRATQPRPKRFCDSP